jgi:very-short-patch-repair endonuclease
LNTATKPKVKREAYILMEKHLDELIPPYDGQRQWASERRFCERKWRFDYVATWALSGGPKLAIEIEGGHWLGKGHTGGQHFQSDCDKYNEASILGWSILRFTTADVVSGSARERIKRWIEARVKPFR